MYNFSTASKPTAVSSAAAPAQTPEKKVDEWLHVIDVREDGTKVVEIWHTSDLESEAVKQEGPAEMAHGVQNLNLETTEDDYRERFYKEYIARGDTESMAERLAAMEAKDAAFVIKLVARLARIEAFERDGNILVDANVCSISMICLFIICSIPLLTQPSTHATLSTDCSMFHDC